MARILIVDDEGSDRLLAQTILARAGHEVVVAAASENALMQHLERAADVVVTDLQILDVDGLELIAMLRVLLPAPAIIAVSSMGDAKLELALELGAQITLAKPVDPISLREAVDDVLSQQALADQLRTVS